MVKKNTCFSRTTLPYDELQMIIRLLMVRVMAVIGNEEIQYALAGKYKENCLKVKTAMHL